MSKRTKLLIIVFSVLVLGGIGFNTIVNPKLKKNKVYELVEKRGYDDADVGSSIRLGMFEQDGNTENGKESISWRVLSKEDNKLFLISNKILDYRKYHNGVDGATWENSDIRKWLNGDFYNDAFSKDEQHLISTTYVESHDNYKHPTIDNGNATFDKVFLLSMKEAKGYFKDNNDRKCNPTQYALLNNDENLSGTKNPSEWFLRTVGGSNNMEVFVFGDGSIFDIGFLQDTPGMGIRPCIFINLEP